MVSSIVPGAPGAPASGVDARARVGQPHQQREASAASERAGAAVADGGGALGRLRDGARDALMLVHQVLALGHDAQGVLVKVQELARSGGGEAQTELSALLSGYQARVDGALASGVRAGGEPVSLQAEPGEAAPVDIRGVDLRLGGEGVIAIGVDARVDDPALTHAAQRSLDALQDAMTRLLGAARALEAHQGFLGAAETAGVRHNLDADAARLLALQARQGLEAAGPASIANVEPKAVLSLFRA